MTTLGVSFDAAIDREARRAMVEGHPTLEGIDFVEVLSNHDDSPHHVAGAPEQRTLLVHLLNRPVPTDWDADRVAVDGGVRPDPAINPVGIEWAWPAVAVVGTSTDPPIDPLPGVSAADRLLVAQAVPDEVEVGRSLVVRTTSAGDWSTYVLRVLGSGGQGAPDDFDPPLASAPFAFTVDCPSDLDCDPPDDAPARDLSSPALDYLARDYPALRTRLLDRMSTSLPEWTDHSPADPGVTLVELFSYVGDRLAYWQDAVAVEAYLGTARRRTSVRRHARLLNYDVHEGCAARTWLSFTTDSDVTVPRHTPVADLYPPGFQPGTAIPVDAVEAGAVVFETCSDLTITTERNALPLYAWQDPEHRLDAGATAAFVSTPAAVDPGLRDGDVLILAAQPPDGGPELGDPDLRFAVRLVGDAVAHIDAFAPELAIWELRWSAEDALARPLPVRARDALDRPLAVALGNVVLADHGGSVADEALEPPQVPDTGVYRPRLRRPGLAYADPVSPDAGPTGGATSALGAARPDARRAVAQVELDDGHRQWLPRPDLLASGRLATHVVVEPGAAGESRLRFGDGITGRRPRVGSQPRAYYRLGSGQRGNVAAGRIGIPLLLPNHTTALPSGATITIWNPLGAVGGQDPESLDQVRQLAPTAFRHQLRAVTPADYAAVAMEDPGVQRAVARRRWAGSWYAEEVTVDPIAARANDPALMTTITAQLEVRRQAGVDVELARPVYVPLHLVLTGCVQEGYLRAEVERQLLDALSSRLLPSGRRGLFHADNLTFGQTLFLSDVVAAAMSVTGLVSVELTRFARMAATPTDAALAVEAGRIDAAAREVLRCDSDPSNPEAGRIDVSLGGGG